MQTFIDWMCVSFKTLCVEILTSRSLALCEHWPRWLEVFRAVSSQNKELGNPNTQCDGVGRWSLEISSWYCWLKYLCKLMF